MKNWAENIGGTDYNNKLDGITTTEIIRKTFSHLQMEKFFNAPFSYEKLL